MIKTLTDQAGNIYDVTRRVKEVPPADIQEVWVNVYPIGGGYGWESKDGANTAAASDRKALVHLTINHTTKEIKGEFL